MRASIIAAAAAAIVAAATQAFANLLQSSGKALESRLDGIGPFIARQKTEANPFRVDAAQDHGVRQNIGSRLKYRDDRAER